MPSTNLLRPPADRVRGLPTLPRAHAAFRRRRTAAPWRSTARPPALLHRRRRARRRDHRARVSPARRPPRLIHTHERTMHDPHDAHPYCSSSSSTPPSSALAATTSPAPTPSAPGVRGQYTMVPVRSRAFNPEASTRRRRQHGTHRRSSTSPGETSTSSASATSTPTSATPSARRPRRHRHKTMKRDRFQPGAAALWPAAFVLAGLVVAQWAPRRRQPARRCSSVGELTILTSDTGNRDAVISSWTHDPTRCSLRRREPQPSNSTRTSDFRNFTQSAPRAPAVPTRLLSRYTHRPAAHVRSCRADFCSREHPASRVACGRTSPGDTTTLPAQRAHAAPFTRTPMSIFPLPQFEADCRGGPRGLTGPSHRPPWSSDSAPYENGRRVPIMATPSPLWPSRRPHPPRRRTRRVLTSTCPNLVLQERHASRCSGYIQNPAGPTTHSPKTARSSASPPSTTNRQSRHRRQKARHGRVAPPRRRTQPPHEDRR